MAVTQRKLPIIVTMASIIMFLVSFSALIFLHDLQSSIQFYLMTGLLYTSFASTLIGVRLIFSLEDYPKTRIDNIFFLNDWPFKIRPDYDKMNTVESLGPYDKNKHTMTFFTRIVPLTSFLIFLIMFLISLVPSEGPLSWDFISQMFFEVPYKGWLLGPVYISVQVTGRIINTRLQINAKEKMSHKQE